MKGLGLRNLAKNVGTTLGRQLLAGFTQLVTLAIIARVYGPAGNGSYSVALLLPATLVSLLNFGIGPANVYYLGSGQVSPLAAWRTVVRLFSIVASVGLILGGAVLFFYAEQLFPEIPTDLLWLALSVFPVTLLLMLISNLFQGLQKFRQFNVVLLLQPLLTLMLVFLLVLSGVKDIGWLLGAYLTSSVVTLGVAMRALKACLSVNVDFPQPANYGRTVLNYGYKAHLSNILTFINYKADIFLVNFFIGPVAAGVYVIAVKLSERLWLLSQAVSTVLLPKLSQMVGEEDKRNKLTPLITRWVLFATLIAALLLAAIAYPVIGLIFGNKFLDAYALLLLLLPGIVAGAASRVLANDIAARGRPELNMYIAFFVITVNIGGNVVLISRYGTSGAALATSIAYVFDFCLRLAMHRHFTGLSVLGNIFVSSDDISGLKEMLKKSGQNL